MLHQNQYINLMLRKTESTVLNELNKHYVNSSLNLKTSITVDSDFVFEKLHTISTTETSFLITIFRMIQSFKDINYSDVYSNREICLIVNYVYLNKIGLLNRINTIKYLFNKLFNNPSITLSKNTLCIEFHLHRTKTAIRINLIERRNQPKYVKSSYYSYGILDFASSTTDLSLLKEGCDTVISYADSFHFHNFKDTYSQTLLYGLSSVTLNSSDYDFIKPEDLFL